MSTSTPWGPSQTVTNVARGVNIYTTASHGGVHVSPGLLETFHPILRDHPTFCGKLGWYEEDCDWCIPVIALPDIGWPPLWKEHALPTLKNYYPELYTKLVEAGVLQP